jgi:hypothetical protein
MIKKHTRKLKRTGVRKYGKGKRTRKYRRRGRQTRKYRGGLQDETTDTGNKNMFMKYGSKLATMANIPHDATIQDIGKSASDFYKEVQNGKPKDGKELLTQAGKLAFQKAMTTYGNEKMSSIIPINQNNNGSV